jgi:uncharacterized protein
MLPFMALLLIYGFFEGRRIIIREYSVYYENLPANFDGYSILHLSDFHFKHFDGRVKQIANYISNLPSDIAVITGDFRNKSYTDWHDVLVALNSLSKSFRVRDGVYACLGNKETIVSIPGLESAGIKILRNSNTRLTRDSQTIYLLGVDEKNPYKDFSVDCVEAIRGVPLNGFKILLSHTPDYIGWAKLFNVQLMLAGDTHGGQISVPWLGPPKVKSKVSRKYARGWIKEGNLRLYVSTGLGSVNLPVRIMCPPEIVRIVLRRGLP